MITSLQVVFRLSDAGIVSIVGAGGKTTLMFRLAGELANAGQPVLTTTTTKIFRPAPAQSAHVIIDADPIKMIRQADCFHADALHITAAAGCDETNGKLLGYAPEAIACLWKSGRFRWILVEADGAARKPLKAPATHEPVIPAETTVLIAVIGLDAVGEPLTEEWVFRSPLYAQRTGCSLGTAITPESICEVLTHPEGIMKGCPVNAGRFVFLNKAQTPFRRAAGRKVGTILKQAGRIQFRDVLMGSLGDENAGIESLMTTGG
ncbi:MAG: selenium cofactor biosynthesis protein YqeC [Pseudomonadota bacterium]